MKRQQRHDNTQSVSEEAEKATILANCNDETPVGNYAKQKEHKFMARDFLIHDDKSFHLFLIYPFCSERTVVTLVTAVPSAFEHI